MSGRAMADKYRDNYATVKRRGVDEANSEYTITVHKRLVRVGGFEYAEDLPLITNVPRGYAADGGAESTRDTFNEDLERFEASLSRSKSRILQIVANNEWDWFVTFTLSAEKVMAHFGLSRYDLPGIKEKIATFMNNYKTRRGLRSADGVSMFRYLLIPEYHLDGAVHYHGVLHGVDPGDVADNRLGNLGFAPMEERFGLSYLAPVGDVMARAAYMSKYISKQMFAGAETLPGRRGIDPFKNLYFCSKGLKRDETLVKGEPRFDIRQYIGGGDTALAGRAPAADAPADPTADAPNAASPVRDPVSNEWVFKVTFRDKAFALSLVRPMYRVTDIAEAAARRKFLRIPDENAPKAAVAASRRMRARQFANDVFGSAPIGGDGKQRPLTLSEVWHGLVSEYQQSGLYGEYVHGSRYELRNAKRREKYGKQPAPVMGYAAAITDMEPDVSEASDKPEAPEKSLKTRLAEQWEAIARSPRHIAQEDYFESLKAARAPGLRRAEGAAAKARLAAMAARAPVVIPAPGLAPDPPPNSVRDSTPGQGST